MLSADDAAVSQLLSTQGSMAFIFMSRQLLTASNPEDSNLYG